MDFFWWFYISPNNTVVSTTGAPIFRGGILGSYIIYGEWE